MGRIYMLLLISIGINLWTFLTVCHVGRRADKLHNSFCELRSAFVKSQSCPKGNGHKKEG